MVVEDTNEIDAVVDRIRRIMLREETLILICDSPLVVEPPSRAD
jgi:hypothetical protein